MTTIPAHRLLSVFLATGFCLAAHAQASPWTLQLGQGADAVGMRSTLVLPMGLGFPGSSASSGQNSVAAELAYSRSADWAAHLALMASSGAPISGGAPSLQDPYSRTVQAAVGVFASHQFAATGAFKPYASAGIVYEGLLAGWQAPGPASAARNSWSLAMQAGFKAPKNQAWRLLLDLKRQQRMAEADGRQRTLRWSPARIALRLSPLRISAGTSLQF